VSGGRPDIRHCRVSWLSCARWRGIWRAPEVGITLDLRSPTPGGLAMDLGIAGRKAIVCASSRGLGRACAFALAQAGCDVVINGRDGKRLDATPAEKLQG